MRFLKFLPVFILLSTEFSYASSRSRIFSMDDRQTILTEYISINNIPHLSEPRSRRASSIWIAPGTVISELDLSNSSYGSVASTVREAPHSIIILEQPPVLSMVIDSKHDLDPIHAAEFIQNNKAFRRDNLNNQSQKSHYILISEATDSSTTYKLAKVDEQLHIKELRKLSSSEAENLTNIEEEVIYNAILYELPSQNLSVLTAVNSINNQLALRDNFFITNNTGVSAGNDFQPVYGLWAKGMSGFMKQSKSDEIDAFKGYNKNGTIGFDLGFDNAILGVAYGLTQSNMKFTASSSKEIVNIHSLSFYSSMANRDFNSFYSLTGGKVFIKNARDLLYDNNWLSSKHKGNLINFTTGGSKKYSSTTGFIIPKVSINYTYLYLNAFKENGVKISKSVERKVSTIPCLTVGKNLYYQHLMITPKIYYKTIIHPFAKRKKPFITILHNSQELTTSKPTYNRLDHSVGASFEVTGTSTLLSVGYEYLIQKKNKAHSIEFTARLQF